MGSASGRCTPGASGWGDLAAGNHRNGYSQKSVTLADERVVLDIPRDRNGPTIRGAVHARKMISATG